MKPWVLLLALPYVVTVRDRSRDCFIYTAPPTNIWLLPCEGKEYHLKGFEVCTSTGNACDYLYDVASVLNEAHARRTASNIDNVETCVRECLKEMGVTK